MTAPEGGMAVERRIAVITGANRGLGFETARQLARHGQKPVLTSRDGLLGKAAADKLHILVNAVDPGWVRTRMGGPNATRTPAQAAEWVVQAATLAADGPTGCFLKDGNRIDW